MADDTTISIVSIVSGKDLKPYVQMTWGKNGCQMTPFEARQHAYGILDAANAAETDSIMATFLRDRIGITAEQIAPVLLDFRKIREKMMTQDLSDGSHKHEHESN